MLPVKQDLRRHQAERRAEHGLFLLAAEAGHELLDHLTQQTVKLVLDLVLDDGQKTEVDKIELIGRLCLSERLGAMHCLRPPPLSVAAEKV